MSVWSLWLPILLSGLATHVWSTLAWMVMPHHKPEWKKLPVEDEFQDWLDAKGVTADQYLFPFSHDPKEMQSEAFKAKMQGKCRGMLVLWPSPPNMGLAIFQTLAFFMVTAYVIGYLASLGLAAGASWMDVFQFVTTAGFLAHCFGVFPTVFWFRRRVAMDLVDKVIYALATGAIFASLWPAAV